MNAACDVWSGAPIGNSQSRERMRSLSKLWLQSNAAGLDVDLFDAYAQGRLKWKRSVGDQLGPFAELYQVTPDEVLDLLRQLVVKLVRRVYEEKSGSRANEAAEAVFDFALMIPPRNPVAADWVRERQAVIEVLAQAIHLQTAAVQPLAVGLCVRHIQFWPTYALQAKELESRSRLLKIPIPEPAEVFDAGSGSVFLETVAVYAKTRLAKQEAPLLSVDLP